MFVAELGPLHFPEKEPATPEKRGEVGHTDIFQFPGGETKRVKIIQLGNPLRWESGEILRVNWGSSKELDPSEFKKCAKSHDRKGKANQGGKRKGAGA